MSRVKVLLLALIPELDKEDWNQTIQDHRAVAANSVLGEPFILHSAGLLIYKLFS